MTPMTCERCEEHLFTTEDPTAPLPPEVTEHLLTCAACTRLRQELAHLDETLTFHAAAQSDVPPDFKASLLARIPPPPERLPPSLAASERLESMQRHQQAVAALERRYLLPHFRILPGFLTLAGVVTLTVLGLFELARHFQLNPVLTVGCGSGLLGLGLALYRIRPFASRPAQARTHPSRA